MSKDKKSKLAVKQKPNKVVKTIAEEKPKQKKQQLEKLKKSVAAEVVEAKTGGKKSNSKKKAPKIVEVKEPESEEEVEADGTEESDDEQMESQPEDAESDQENEESDEQDDAENGKEEKKIKRNNNHTIFIKKVPQFTERTDLVKLFSPYGKVLSIMFRFGTRVFFASAVNRKFANAFVVLDSPEAADKAMALSETILNGQKIFLARHMNKTRKQLSPERTVFVKDMDPSTNNVELKKFFASCGKIEFANLVRFDEGKGYVVFKRPESVNMALKLDGNLLKGKNVNVIPYNPKAEGSKKFKKSEFRGVQSKVIQKTPKKKLNKNVLKETK